MQAIGEAKYVFQTNTEANSCSAYITNENNMHFRLRINLKLRQ